MTLSDSYECSLNSAIFISTLSDAARVYSIFKVKFLLEPERSLICLSVRFI